MLSILQIQHLYRKLFPRVSPRKVLRAQRYVRPRLQVLEARIVPDALTWTPVNGSNDYMAAQNWVNNTNPLNQRVPGSSDTATVPAMTPICILNSTTAQTVAGLTVGGSFDLFSKLSVTTGTSNGNFDTETGSELDNVGSFDFYGTGTLQGQIDAGGSNVTFHPFSGMTLGNGVLLTGLGAYIINGTVTDNAAITLNVPMFLNNDGGTTTAGNLVGPGSLDVGSNFDWSGGTLGLSGGVSLEPSSGFKTSGPDPKILAAGTLSSLAQLLDLGGTGGLDISGTTTKLDILAGQTNVSLPDIAGDPPPNGTGLFVNEANGNVKFESPTGTLVSVNFTNNGNLFVAAAPGLTLSSGGGAAPPLTVNLDGTRHLDDDLSLIGTIASPTGMIVAAGAGHLKVGVGPFETATLTLAGNDTVLFGYMEVTGYGTLTGTSQLDNNGNLILDLGSSNTVGAYVQSSTGTLEEHASGPGANSMLMVTGHAQLSGTLKMDFDGGYVPAHGDSWTVLTAGSIGAHFDTIPGNTTASYGSTSVGLTEN